MLDALIYKYKKTFETLGDEYGGSKRIYRNESFRRRFYSWAECFYAARFVTGISQQSICCSKRTYSGNTKNTR
jgi:hypothetical protein